MKRENAYYILNLNGLVIDLQVNDLGKFINRLMFKNSYSWKFDRAKMLIEAYCSINKLDKNELQALLAFIIFPYKFCKLGKKRYVRHKAWDEAKYMRKLGKLTRYNDMQDKFLKEYLKYLNGD
jgi:CotS family spore coat protein